MSFTILEVDAADVARMIMFIYWSVYPVSDAIASRPHVPTITKMLQRSTKKHDAETVQPHNPDHRLVALETHLRMLELAKKFEIESLSTLAVSNMENCILGSTRLFWRALDSVAVLTEETDPLACLLRRLAEKHVEDLCHHDRFPALMKVEADFAVKLMRSLASKDRIDQTTPQPNNTFSGTTIPMPMSTPTPSSNATTTAPSSNAFFPSSVFSSSTPAPSPTETLSDAPSAPSTRDFTFVAVADTEGPGNNQKIAYQNISFCPSYTESSVEELRLADYRDGQAVVNIKGQPSIFDVPASNVGSAPSGLGRAASTGLFGNGNTSRSGGLFDIVDANRAFGLGNRPAPVSLASGGLLGSTASNGGLFGRVVPAQGATQTPPTPFTFGATTGSPRPYSMFGTTQATQQPPSEPGQQFGLESRTPDTQEQDANSKRQKMEDGTHEKVNGDDSE